MSSSNYSGNYMTRMPALLLIDAQENEREAYQESLGVMLTVLEFFRSRCYPIIFKLWRLGGEGTAQQRLFRKHFSNQRIIEQTCQRPLPLRELAPITKAEANRTVETFRFDMFASNQRLTSLLRGWGVNTVVLVGGYTEQCIAATAYSAFEHEFDVILVVDALAPRSGRGDILPSLAGSVARVETSTGLINAWTDAKFRHSHGKQAVARKGSVCPHTRTDIDAKIHGPRFEEHTRCTPHGTVDSWPHWNPATASYFLEKRE